MPKGDILGKTPEEDDAEDGDDMTDAASDVLEAIADKDAGALALALRRCMAVCESDEDDSDEE